MLEKLFTQNVAVACSNVDKLIGPTLPRGSQVDPTVAPMWAPGGPTVGPII